MTKKANIELYERRSEPADLRDPITGKYINLRTTKDVALLEGILSDLISMGPDYVLASWISPPFGVIKGYGTYPKEEAESHAKQSQSERWGFPRFGYIYNREKLEAKIEKLRGEYNPHLTY